MLRRPALCRVQLCALVCISLHLALSVFLSASLCVSLSLSLSTSVSLSVSLCVCMCMVCVCVAATLHLFTPPTSVVYHDNSSLEVNELCHLDAFSGVSGSAGSAVVQERHLCRCERHEPGHE